MNKYPLIWKGLAVGIILLLVGTCIIPSAAQNIEKPSLPTSRGNWLYVGGSGPGNYSKIQNAVDNASDGDTIFVYDNSSPYYENVVIKKHNISLIGEDKNTTVIDGRGILDATVVAIGVDNVKIAGFMIINGYVGIVIGSHSNMITGNIICFNIFYGIWAGYEGSSNVIMGNTLFENSCGIQLEGSSKVDIIDNVIYSNKYDGVLFYNTVSNCTITGNIISNNDRGINIYGFSPNNLIRRNTFQNNNLTGVLINWYSDNNRIEENNFIGNRKNGRDECNHGNVWLDNYWDDWIGLKFHGPICQKFPKIIRLGGFIRIFTRSPFLVCDWHPAQEPYDIPGMR
jgi:parallel beta-helix repeat protein